jgi:D-alanyl-D-alanine dipeptidase
MISHVTRIFRQSIALPVLILATFIPPPIQVAAQTTGSPLDSILAGPKPPDVSLEWKQFLGIYGPVNMQIIILERDGQFFWSTPKQGANQYEWPLILRDNQLFMTTQNGLESRAELLRDSSGAVISVKFDDLFNFQRVDAGTDPGHFYHVTPARPVTVLREKALRLKPPVEVGPFRKPDFVELTTVDPAIHLDIRYASAKNFLSTPVYTEARAFMQRPAAEALLRVLQKLQPLGFGLLIHDAYRPWYVTKIFWDATPLEGKTFVADPEKGSKHNRGCAVDLTLYDLATGKAVEMPGLYDEMSPRSFPNFPGGSSLQRWHRDLLRRAMESEGFTVNEDEWWHFDYKDWKQYGILNVPFEKIAGGSD